MQSMEDGESGKYTCIHHINILISSIHCIAEALHDAIKNYIEGVYIL